MFHASQNPSEKVLKNQRESRAGKLESDSAARKNRGEGTSLSALTRLRRPAKLIKPSEILRGEAKKWRHGVGAAQGCKQSFDVDGGTLSQTERTPPPLSLVITLWRETQRPCNPEVTVRSDLSGEERFVLFCLPPCKLDYHCHYCCDYHCYYYCYCCYDGVDVRSSGEASIAGICFLPFWFCCFNNGLLLITVVIKRAAVRGDTHIKWNFSSSRKTYAGNNLEYHLAWTSPIFTGSCVWSHDQPWW